MKQPTKQVLWRSTMLMSEDLKYFIREGGFCDKCIVNDADCVGTTEFNCVGVIRAAYIKKAERELKE